MAAQASHGQRNYDVFLSFRGEDTRKNITNHLYYGLTNAGINVFRDDKGLPKGEHISTHLKQAIHCSRMSIVVFSKNYASSSWCLEELEEIIDCKKNANQIVVPVFYDVDPKDVRHQKRTFAEAFAKHEERFVQWTEKVATWREALAEAANLSGYHFNDGFEGELINKIVREILEQLNVHRTQELPIPTTQLEGEAFERNQETIWCWLMDDQVSTVGIYGMGGVGKTTLMTHIQNQLRKEWRSSFRKNCVCWVMVSQDFNIYKIQNLIANKIGLGLTDYESEGERAAKLSHALTQRGKCILILDDLWNHFDVLRVGIPVSSICKLVITTRSWNVCQQIHCKEENLIKVQPLSNKEAWNLFTKELGSYSLEVEPLAKDIAKECSGLPLGIKTMASSMRGVSDICEWRNVLEELKESKARQGDIDEVFCVLKLSYLRLNDSTLQKCFLYCALFPEDYQIKRDKLIELLIVEGIIEEKKRRVEEFDRGHTMLNRLENVCLLEGIGVQDFWMQQSEIKDLGDYRYVKMHDLIRDMAIRELRESSTTQP